MFRPPAATAPTPTPASPSPSGVERLAWAFYTIAALGSSIGQIWVGVEVPPWPDAMPVWLRAVLVLPFAVVIDLGGAVSAAFADARRRLGETAYGWRILSAASVTLGVGINIVGHADVPYLAAVFGSLGIFAYCVWLLHSAARRRDALRAAGKLANTTPAYGLLQWKREPEVTRRARALALEHGYGLVESLTIARAQIAAETRRAALAHHIDAKIRSRHADPILAAIAATTTPVDEVAEELMDMIDTRGWAESIRAEIDPPTPVLAIAAAPAVEQQDDDGVPDTDDGDSEETEQTDQLDQPVELARLVPTNPAAYRRWRTLWIEIGERPDATNKQLADDLDASVRTVQRIRAVGAAGLLDSPQPPNGRLLRPASTNGVSQRELTP